MIFEVIKFLYTVLIYRIAVRISSPGYMQTMIRLIPLSLMMTICTIGLKHASDTYLLNKCFVINSDRLNCNTRCADLGIYGKYY